MHINFYKFQVKLKSSFGTVDLLDHALRKSRGSNGDLLPSRKNNEAGRKQLKLLLAYRVVTRVNKDG